MAASLKHVLNPDLGYVEELEEGGETLLVLMAGGQMQHRHTALTSSSPIYYPNFYERGEVTMRP